MFPRDMSRDSTPEAEEAKKDERALPLAGSLAPPIPPSLCGTVRDSCLHVCRSARPHICMFLPTYVCMYTHTFSDRVCAYFQICLHLAETAHTNLCVLVRRIWEAHNVCTHIYIQVGTYKTRTRLPNDSDNYIDIVNGSDTGKELGINSVRENTPSGYIYIYILRSSRKPSGCFLVMVSVVDIIQRFVYGFRRLVLYGFRRRRKRCLFMVSVVDFLMVSVVAGKHFFCMVSVAGFLVDSATVGGSTILECIERFLVFVCIFRTGFGRSFFFGLPPWQDNFSFYGFRR